ncbi:MAG: universal stress protein [Chthoniobacterales bacterium]
MYQEILVALDNSITDLAMIPHIAKLVRTHGSKLPLLHVSDGWVARNSNRFQLAESEGMKGERATSDWHGQRLTVETELALGELA